MALPDSPTTESNLAAQLRGAAVENRCDRSSAPSARLSRSGFIEISRRAARWLATLSRVLRVRLRFVAVLVIAFLIVSKWRVLRNYWDAMTRSIAAIDTTTHAVSLDTEYFCPMDPGVVSDWSGKCGICNMALVRRKKGTAERLPEGVVARMQLSPYRVQLAGIQTSVVSYRPLIREIVTVGFVRGSREREATPQEAAACCGIFIQADVFQKDVPLLKQGQLAELTNDTLAGTALPAARVEAIQPGSVTPARTTAVRLAIDSEVPGLRPGMLVTVRIKVPAVQLEPFRSMPRSPPDASPGEVLAVPEMAVVDTGSKKIVYIEQSPGMFHGVEVVLGPRCGDFYPVVRGLQAGQRVAATGAFLIDAETRLNRGAAVSYFGASGASAAASSRSIEPTPAVDSDASPVGKGRSEKSSKPAEQPPEPLSPEDAALVAQQKTCPVTGLKLGSMGRPARVVVNGRAVFLCCKSCEKKLRENPDEYLAKLKP